MNKVNKMSYLNTFSVDYIDFNKLPIIVVVRDINGKRVTFSFKNVEFFNSVMRELMETKDDTDINDIQEFLLVTWGNHCIYNALVNDPITLEDLIGFFA